MSVSKPHRTIENTRAAISCAFCRAKGIDPFGVPSVLSSCQVCSGRKEVTVPPPQEQCGACKGTGVFRHHRLPCSVCGGKGMISKLRHGEERCKGCSGAGLEAGTGLPCVTCYGLGVIGLKKQYFKTK